MNVRVAPLAMASEPAFVPEVAASDLIAGPVSEFPEFEYSKREVRAAGEALKGTLPWSAETEQVFKIANSWLDSHAYPMRAVRYALIGQLRRLRMASLTAARLKRMHSIRNKLRRIKGNLTQINDLGGVRAIVPAMADVNALLVALRQNNRHPINPDDEYDYINEPKPDGYRSHHLVYRFRGEGEADVFTGRRIELQVRTRIQHSWATAVEAVGLFRGEDLKAGQGSPDWLRLFQLMSAEFARAEGCPEPENAIPRRLRVEEIKELDRKLEAAAILDNMSVAFDFTDRYYLDTVYKPKYFLIKYNNLTRTVEVEPHSQAKEITRLYHDAEKSGGAYNVVLVEVDKVENLKAAYPNYFGDVQLFRKNLRLIARGKEASEYTLPPQEVVRTPRSMGDTSWMRRTGRRRF
jgi:ppGpp synthetase/RelA/SpoT-type nucleotidyltranferase